MCHLTKKHKDRTLGSQSRALELCGIVYDPNAPLPPPATSNRASTEGSPLDAAAMDQEGEPQDGDLDSEYEEGEGDEAREEQQYGVKTETTDRSIPDADETATPPKPALNGSTKQSISSIIDSAPESEPREALASLRRSESIPQAAIEPSIPAKRKHEYSSPAAEKENTEPKRGSATD